MKQLPPEVFFDQAYYDRFYLDPATQVYNKKSLSHLTTFIFSYLKYLKLPLHQVLDVGCGLGNWKGEVEKHAPRALYTGVEYSEHMCREFGWQQGSVVDFNLDKKFDLVICQSVVQYLEDHEVKKAIKNLANHCCGAMFLELVTLKDWEEHCDQRVTDNRIYLREGSWYKKIIRRYFRPIGGGLFLSKNASVTLWDLEET